MPVENRVLLVVDRKLVLPSDFHDYAWEVESKGVFWDAAVQIGDNLAEVTFYDPVRLSQDVEEELAARPSVGLRRVLVVRAVTEEQMRAAAMAAPAEFYT